MAKHRAVPSESAGGPDKPCSPGLAHFTKFTAGAPCFILSSHGEEGAGRAGCPAGNVDYLPWTSFHLLGVPTWAPRGEEETAQAGQLLQGPGILGTEVLPVMVEAGWKGPRQRLRGEATLLLGLMGQNWHVHWA